MESAAIYWKDCGARDVEVLRVRVWVSTTEWLYRYVLLLCDNATQCCPLPATMDKDLEWRRARGRYALGVQSPDSPF